jgi:peptidyl-prolyl cis-trans isomerase C
VADGIQVPARVFRMFVANAVDAAGARSASERQRVSDAVLEDLIDRALVAAEAKRRGVVVSPAEVERRMAQWRSSFGGTSGFEAHLARHGLSSEDWRQIAWQELAGAAVADALTAGVAVTHAEIAAFYRKHVRDPRLRALFVEPERVRAAHIFLDARPAVLAARGPAEAGRHDDRSPVERQRQRAESLRRRAAGGADFAALARAWSDDAGTRDRGGDLGTFTRGTHARAFDAAAFALRPGEIGPVVRTEFGFHVIKVLARAPGRTRTLEECRAAIGDRLLARARAARLAAWREARRRTATITRSPGPADDHGGKGR